RVARRSALPCAPAKSVCRVRMRRSHLRFALLLAAVALSACGSVVRRATNQFADNLTNAILDQDDPGTVRDGVPAYLLLIDGMIAGDPQNAEALLAGSKL